MVGIRADQEEIDCLAAVQNGLEAVKDLVANQGVDVNIIGKDGWTFLTSSFLEKKKEIIEYLINQGADVNKIDGKDRNAIGFAIYDNDEALLRILPKDKLKVNLDPTSEETPPLTFALMNSGNGAFNINILRYLVEDLNANANISVNGDTPLLRAVINIKNQDRLLLVAKLLIEKGGAKVSQAPYKGFTPLFFVLSKGYKKVADYFYKHLVQEKGIFAIVDAAKNEQYDTVIRYLDKKKFAWSKDDVNKLVSCTLGVELPQNILDKLFNEYGSMVDLEKRYYKVENTIFIDAARKGRIGLLKAIKAYFPKIDVDQRNNLEQTGLMYACFTGKLETVKYLIEELNADISLKDKGNSTGLMRASEKGRIHVVKYLLEEKKIEINNKINELKSSIIYAIRGDHDEVADYLLKKFQGQLNDKQVNGIAKAIAQHGAVKVMKIFLDIDRFEKLLKFENKDLLDIKIEDIRSLHDFIKKDNTFLGTVIKKVFTKNKHVYFKEAEKLALLKLLVEKKKVDLKKGNHIVNLLQAIMHKQFAIANYLIQEAAFKVNKEVASELFILAAKHLRADILNSLLSHDKIAPFFSLTMKNENEFEKTFLDYLIRRRTDGNAPSEEEIGILEWLDSETKISLEGEQGKQVVLVATKNNRAKIVKKILPKIKTEWTSEEIHQLFYQGIIAGSYKAVKLLLQNSKMESAFNITTKVSLGNQQFSCLDIFTSLVSVFDIDLLGKTKILALLLKYGKFDFEDKKKNEKIWFTACSEDNPYMLQYLLQSNIVKADIKNSKGQNGLIVALTSPNIGSNVLKFLTKKTDINIDEKDYDNQTAYDYAVKHKKNDAIVYIESGNKDPQLKNDIQKIELSDTDDSSQEEFKQERKVEEETKKDDIEANIQEQLKEYEKQKKLKATDSDTPPAQQIVENKDDFKDKKEKELGTTDSDTQSGQQIVDSKDDFKEKQLETTDNETNSSQQIVDNKHDFKDKKEKQLETTDSNSNPLQQIKNNNSNSSEEDLANGNMTQVPQQGSTNHNKKSDILKNGKNDLNQGKPTDFKFIAKVVVFLIAGIAVFLGLPYYLFRKKAKTVVAK